MREEKRETFLCNRFFRQSFGGWREDAPKIVQLKLIRIFYFSSFTKICSYCIVTLAVGSLKSKYYLLSHEGSRQVSINHFSCIFREKLKCSLTQRCRTIFIEIISKPVSNEWKVNCVYFTYATGKEVMAFFNI